ncbi:hypothetical protein ACLOJK_040810 [Asimina triloba]
MFSQPSKQARKEGRKGAITAYVSYINDNSKAQVTQSRRKTKTPSNRKVWELRKRMDSKSKSSSADNRTYEDLQPLTSWRREEQSDVFVINLPGFEKQHLKILLDSTGKMKIIGERPQGLGPGQGNKWQRFREDLQVHQACDLNAIRAKFEKGILTVTMPKTNTSIIAPTPSKTSTPPSPSAAAGSKPTDGAANAKEPAPAKPTDGPANAEEPAPVPPPSAAAAPLVGQDCRPVSAGSFFYRYRKAAKGTMLAAAALTAGIYVIYKFGIFQAHNGE